MRNTLDRIVLSEPGLTFAASCLRCGFLRYTAAIPQHWQDQHWFEYRTALIHHCED
jgi:hypothetical protein